MYVADVFAVIDLTFQYPMVTNDWPLIPTPLPPKTSRSIENSKFNNATNINIDKNFQVYIVHGAGSYITTGVAM